MKIAVVGAGLAGLSICYHLLQRGASVTLFEEKGIGAGASGMASGFLHPYPGLEGRRSAEADDAYISAKELLQTAQPYEESLLADFSGIYRHTFSAAQLERFCSHEKIYKDVKRCEENLFFIESGIAIQVPAYLRALWGTCEAKGAKWILQKVTDLAELEREFDRVAIAAGASLATFFPKSGLHFVKGQVVQFLLKVPLEHPRAIRRGYATTLENPLHVEIGSTYERDFVSVEPEMDKALRLMDEQIQFFLKEEAKPIHCRAGVRVCRPHHYLPLIQTLSQKSVALTALGSRGLLYHGLYGKKVATLLVN